MKSILVVSRLDGRGVTKGLFATYLTLDHAGLNPTILCLTKHFGVENRFGFRMIYLNCRRSAFSLISLVRYLSFLSGEYLIISYEEHCSVLVGLSACFKSSACSIKLVHSSRVDLYDRDAFGGGVKSLLLKFAFKYLVVNKFQLVSSVSTQLSDKLDKFFDSPGRFLTLRNPLIFSYLDPISESKYNFLKENKERFWVFVGSLDSHKGFEFIIDAFVTYRRRGGLFKLVVVGDGPLKDFSFRFLKSIGLADEVFFWTGEAPVRVMRFAAALLFRSQGEGFPNVVLESVSCGTPVITSYFENGLEESLEMGFQIYTVESSVQALANCLLRSEESLSNADIDRVCHVPQQFTADEFLKTVGMRSD